MIALYNLTAEGVSEMFVGTEESALYAAGNLHTKTKGACVVYATGTIVWSDTTSKV